MNCTNRHFRIRPRWLAAPLGLLVALSSGCASGPVPAAEFVAQAETLHAGALQSTVNPDRDLNDYFAEIGKRILRGAAGADARYTSDPVFAGMQFHLVGSPLPNAFTTGGRHIYIYSGLFQLCDDEEELAVVMAHEFAHAVDLDVQRTGMKPDPKNTLDKIAYALVAHPFTGEMEQQADARAFTFYARGGWDPARFPEIFQTLTARGLASPGEGTAEGRVSLARREAAVQAVARSLSTSARDWRQPPVADAQSFRELRAKAAGGSEAATPRDRAWLYLRAFPNCLLPNDLPPEQAAQQQLRKDVTPPPPVRGGLEPS